MADIELVIRIPEGAYNLLKTSGVDWLGAEHILDAVSKGTPLSKGHGDLVDRNSFEYLKTIHDAVHGKISWSDALHKIRYSAPTIIPATKEGESE